MNFGEYSFLLNEVQIKTTVTNDFTRIGHLLSSFLRAANVHNGTKVIGFDTEWIIDTGHWSGDGYCTTTCAALHLCDGHSCLITQPPLYYSKVPQSLLDFLPLPDYTFVGVGIKHSLAKLEKQYGIGFRNVVELGDLAATVMKMPRLSFCGVDEIASVVNNLDLRKHRPLSLPLGKGWGQHNLSKELVELATVNVYSYYKIGSTLLAC